MFSIGFAEILVVAVILLIVVGPERLPEAIRGVSVQLSKFQRYWSRAKRDLEKELGLDDIRREIHNAEVMEHLRTTQKLLKDPVNTIADDPEVVSAPKEPPPEPSAKVEDKA